MKLILTMTNSWIEGEIPKEHYRAIDDACGAPIKPMQYKAMMRNHIERVHPTPMWWCRWCMGYKTVSIIQTRFVRDGEPTQYCRIPTGFYNRVIPLLRNRGIFPDIIDRRRIPEKIDAPQPGIALRDYQQHIVNCAMSRTRGMWQSPTGSGKTIVLLAVALKRSVKTLIVVPTKTILLQFCREYKRLTGFNPGIICGGTWAPTDFTIATLQMLHSRRSTDEYRSFMQSIGFVGIDEYHHGSAPTWVEVVQDTEAYYRYGQSATLHREDGMEVLLEGATGSMICTIPEAELIDDGWIARPLLIALHFPNAFREATFADAQRYNIFENPNPVRACVALCRRHASDRIIILTTRIALLETISAALNEQGIQHCAIHGRKSAGEVSASISAFRNGEVNVLIATQMMDEGLDVPAANVLILPCGGLSEIKQKQRAGRVLRPKQDGGTTIIYDFVYEDRGYLKRHWNTRLNRYRAWGWDIEHIIWDGQRLIEPTTVGSLYA